MAAGDLLDRTEGKQPGAFNMIFGRHGSFIHLTAPDGAIWWSAQVSAAVAPDPRSVSLAELAGLFGDAPRAAAIVRATHWPHTATINHVLTPIARQHTERMVLIGDAAHPVGAGQGASMAIEDAIVLGRELAGAGAITACLRSFDGLRRERLGKMAKSASANRDTKTAGPLAARMRDLIMPITFNWFYERATGWLYDYDPGTLPAASKRASSPASESAGDVEHQESVQF
jgi:2-polyprenyl-6-methoxyphenol hydroxylase-like FAD-dependent oxidoreductase